MWAASRGLQLLQAHVRSEKLKGEHGNFGIAHTYFCIIKFIR
jgi:hypothetical protein